MIDTWIFWLVVTVFLFFALKGFFKAVFVASGILLVVATLILQASGGTSLFKRPSDVIQQVAMGVRQVVSKAEASTPNAETRNVDSASLVAAHNKWRAQVGVPPLRWSNTVAKGAQKWANELKSRNCAMIHSRQEQYGENLFWASARRWSGGRREVQNISGAFVVNDWASEDRDYNYKKNKCRFGRQCGHYTAVVSRRTEELGCGVAVCGDKSQVWVCRYNPPGNIVGERPY